MLRQSLPLEAAYYYLATQTNIALAQLTLLRDLYREALQGRNAFLAEAAEFGGPPMRDRNDGREEFEAKVQAFGTSLDKKLKALLTPQQTKQLAAWRARDQGGPGGNKPPKRLPGKSAFVWIDPVKPEPKLFDFVQVTERSGGYKVRLGKGQQLAGYGVLNVVFREDDRRAITEPLSYELHRRVGSSVFFSNTCACGLMANRSATIMCLASRTRTSLNNWA